MNNKKKWELFVKIIQILTCFNYQKTTEESTENVLVVAMKKETMIFIGFIVKWEILFIS
jgi:hypothetical protein